MSDLLRSPKGRAIAIAGGGVLVLAAVWFLLVSPQKSKAADLDAQISLSRAELSQRRLALSSPSANVNVRPSDLYRLTKALPNDAGMADILLDVNRIASQNNLAFRSIAPSPAVPGTGYLKQPMDIAVEGRFGDISRFLRDVRLLVGVRKGRLDARGRLYSVTRVELTEPDAPKVFPIVRAKVTLNAFSFSAPAPAAKPDPSTTGDETSQAGSVAAGATP